MTVTPRSIEQRLLNLEGAIEDAYDYAAKMEIAYQDAKSAYELGMARSRTLPRETKTTAQEREQTFGAMVEIALAAGLAQD